MDQTAIKAIADLSAAQRAQEALNKTDIEAIVIPEGYKLHSTEHLMKAPDRFRGRFRTSVLSQFISYLENYGGDNTGIFINQSVMSADAIIDMGQPLYPQWGYHRAEVALKRTPAFHALTELNDKRLDQLSFIDFAEDWQENIWFYYDDVANAEPEAFKPTINVLRKLTKSTVATSESEVGNFSGSRSALEQVEITAGYEKPPAGFVFKTIPFEGFDEVAFDCQLRAIADGNVVQLKYRIAQLERHKELIAEQFKNLILSGIDVHGISIFIGDMKYQQ